MATPNKIGCRGGGLGAAHEDFVGDGKNHAVSVGLIVSTAPSPVVCAVAVAGTGDVRVRTPH